MPPANATGPATVVTIVKKLESIPNESSTSLNVGFLFMKSPRNSLIIFTTTIKTANTHPTAYDIILL